MKPRIWTLLLLFVMAWTAAGHATPIDIELSEAQRSAVLAEAQAAFDRGLALRESDAAAAREAFEEAAGKFALLVSATDNSGPVFYNLANAYLMAGQPGHAIANYHRAAAAMPGDPRIASNLAIAQEMVQTDQTVSRPGAIATVLANIPHSTALWVGLIAWYALWIGLTAAVVWRIRLLRYAVIPVAAVALLAFAVVGFNTYQRPEAPRVVIVADTTFARTGDGHAFTAMQDMPLREGAEYQLLDQRHRWLRIELADGMTGWVPIEDAEVIGETLQGVL